MGRYGNSKFGRYHSKLANSAVSAALLLFLLCICLFTFFNHTVGWFAENRDVSASGMTAAVDGFQVRAEYYYKTDRMTEFAELTTPDNIFSNLMPGNTVTLKAVYTNATDKAYTANIFLTPGSGGEVPLIKDGNGDGIEEYYYFGSQLRMIAASANGGTPTKTDGPFLVSPGADSLSHPSAVTVEDTRVAMDLILPASGILTFEATLEFINYTDIDQNVYQSFGTQGSETCYRYIRAEFSE